jgi:glycine C-acetyltransferase
MIAASALAALEVLEEEPQLIDTLWSNVAYFKKSLDGLGFDTGVSKSPIIPIITGKASLAYSLSDKLLERGIFAQGIGYPTVPEEKSRIRMIVTAPHSREDLDLCLEALAHAGKELEII